MIDGTYNFIYDENQIKTFFQKHIKPFQSSPYLSFLIIPTARRKYFPELSTSQTVLRSCDFPCNIKNDENRLILLLKRLQIQQGSYKDKKTGKALPSEAFAIYLTVDPLNEIRAYNKLQKQMADRFENLIMNGLHKSTSEPTNESYDISNYSDKTDNQQPQTNLNLESVYKSCLHSCPEKGFKKLDVDSKDESNINRLKTLFKENNIDTHLVVETKGGFHVILNSNNLTSDAQKNLHLFSTQNKNWMSVEKTGCLVAIPGTLQAGFQVKIVEW